MVLLWVFFVLFQYSEGTNQNGFEISDAEIIRDDRLPEHEIFGEPVARPDYAPMYDYRFFSSEEFNYQDFLLGPLLKVSQKSADVAYNQEIPCRKASRPLPSGALICFAEEPIHAGLIEKFADRGDSFCQSHGYDYMVDSINSADFVSLAQLHKEILTADPQFPPEVTINAIRSSSTEMRWCEGNCEVMDFTVSSNLVSTGSTPTNFAEVFDPQSNQFNLAVISNGGPNPMVQLAKNITPACITKPRDQSDPLMKVYPLVFEYHANDSVVPLNPNTALPDASMTLRNYALIGSKYAPQFAPKTQHEVTLQRLKNFKRTQLSFFHLCGTKNANASLEGYCKLDVSLKGPNFDDVFKPVANFSDSELKNDGTLMTSSPWQRKRVQIPRLHLQDYKMRIRGEFDWKNGGIGLDSIRLSTMQRCHPRWFRVHETQFITSTSFLFQDGLDNYELGGVSETLLRTKHQRETVLSNQTTLEECSRLCWLGSGCDIFEYDSALKSCRFHPHTTLKQELWSKFAQYTSQPTTALYVLECSESQENILIESDPEYHRSDLWNVDIECGELFLAQSQWNDKAAVFGGKQRVVGMDCGANQKLEIKGNLKTVSKLPMTINQAYLDAAKPGAMATVYFRSSEASEVDISVGTGAKTVTLAKNESMGVTLYTANFDTHYSADDEILVKATAGGAGSKIYMTRIDMALDLPIRIGCFGDPANVLDVSGSITDPGQSPALCLTTCLQAGKRFAFVKGGDQCLCFDEISQSLTPEPQQSCNLPCSGDGEDFCGGSNSMSVFVATCPTSMVRFGDYCYFLSDTNDHSITKNERLCTETDDSAHLWYPESEEELAFVKEKFPSTSYHIGYRQSHPNYGFQHSDYSMGFGLPFFTADRSGLPAFEEEADLFRTKCVIWESGNNNKFTLKSPCEDSKGICRRKLAQGYGYKLIGSYLKYQSMTSLKVKDATPVTGLGPFHFELDTDYYVKERYIEMMLPEPVVMSGLMVETDNTRYLQEFTLQYLEMASLFPERLRNVEITHKSPVIFRVIEDSLTEEPAIISRKIMLPYPIETKHFRMTVRKGGPQIAVRLDIIGQLVSERYQLNPFLDQRQLQFDIPNVVLIQKSSYGLTKFNLNPGGAITIRLVLPTHQKTPENDVNVVIVSRIFLVDSKGKATKFTLRIPKADMRLNILIENEIGLTFSEELRGPFPNNPTYNSPVEIRVEFQTNGFKLFVNGMQIKLFKDMVVNNVVPKLTRITWGTSVFGAQISRVTIETDNELGLSYDYGRTLFNTQQTEETKVDLAPYKDNVILKDESTLLQMFYRAYSFKPNEYDFGYIPFQFIQQCYHSYNGNAKCFPAKGIFNYEKNVNYGYGGGTLASEILRCPSGYEYFGHVCVNFPVRNPESYTAASSKCAPKGDMVYYSPNKLQNTLFRQAMMFLYKNEPSHTIWVGVRQISGEWIASNGRVVTEQFSDWAPNEPNLANGDCAVADKLLGYKWRTTNCAEPHASMCALKVPNCPPGYIYETKLSDAPQYGSRSCYKITKLGSFIDSARAKRVSSVSVADSICLRDHTRLFAPRNAFQADMIHDWLSKHTIWDKDTNATHKVSFFTGVRSFSNTTIIAANDFEPSKTLNSSSLGSNCFRIDYEWGYSMIETPCDQESDLPIDYDNREFFGICQYKECRTTVNSTCSFPFRFNGRLYDTCVSLGPDSTPWCSTGVDDNLNHIPGYEKFCDSTCHVDNCPLGFYRNYMDRTCYQVSSKFPRDGALSFDDALMKCQTQGARLWEPRTTSAFSNILKTDMAIPHFAWMANAATATGLRAKMVGGSVTVVYQGSDVPMSEDLKSALIWETGYPVASPPCIGLVNGKLKNVDCDGYQNDFADTKHLGYICEARPSETVPEKRTCIFPFVYQGKTYSSCTFSANPNVPDETPWCATKVDPITKEMTNSGVCQDERLIIYDGGAQGWPCSFPFLFNGRFYDSCTRDMKNATSNETYKIDRYWCPPQHFVHPKSKLWLGDDSKPETYGFCNDLMRPLVKECPDGYEMVERICMRLSAVPQTHQVAQEDCKKDGADLAFFPSQPVQAALGQRIVEKKAKWNHFVPIKEFWLGAFPKPNGDWDWISYPKPMRLYENWKSSKLGYGCPEQSCTLPHHGLVMKADGLNDWLAGNKTVERPYICSAKCPSGYTWVERIQKCILIVEASSSSPKAKTLPEAMEHCNQQHGRLIITNHCDELNNVRQVLIDLEHGLGEEFFIGTFAFNLQSANERRRSKVTEEQISSFGYSVDMQADSGSGLCGAMEPSLSAPDTSVTHYFGLKLDATDLITLHYPFMAKYVPTIKKGYICESDDFWGCPEGYEKLMETCVKLVRTKKKRIDAHKACEALGTHLARPQTAMDIFALHSKIVAIESKGTETPMQVTSRYHLDFSRIMDPNHPAFDPSHSDIGCVCQNDIVIPGTTKGSDGNCYMKNTYSNTFEQARQRCMNLGMNLAQYESAEEYTAIWNIFGSNEDLWIGAHNPSLSTCADATACDSNFKWVQDGRNVDCSAAINTQGCQSVSGAQCLTLKKNESGKLMDEPCTSVRQSLCQKPCLSGHDDALPRDCVSIQMAMQGDYPALTRVTCDEESFFVCEREQSLKSDLRAFLAKPVAAVPLTRDIGPADIASNLDVQVHNVGFDFDRKPNLLLGSALLGGDAFENSGIDVNLKDLIPGDQITVSMWLRTRDASFPTDPQILVDFRGNASSTPPFNESQLELLNGIPQITLYFPNGTKTTKVSQFGLEPQKWHFLSFSFDSSNGQGYLILDDLVTHFQAPGLVIFDTTADMALLFGSSRSDPSGLAFKGSISCLQVYDQAFTPPQVHFTKNCSYAAGSYQNQEPLCPSGWTSFHDHCYWVSLTKMTFSEASVYCAGASEFTQTAHLIWNLDKLHMDHASRLVNESFGIHKFWIGLDDRLQVGSWVAHDAAMSTIDGTYEYWEDPTQISHPTRRCGLNSRRNGGFIVSEDCELIYPFVCQMKTLNHPSSNRCPSGYLPYQSKCISGNTTRLDYDEAQESCAIKGGILFAPKSKVALETAKAFAKVYVKGDIWVGVTAEHVD
ncbi:uncharacterized protein LOC131885346 [Tigriopus californicus]|uniref:uncharacterized protein LOC131885346 n=1 Tax=Tigriopus californicus TaxID=6832 RepID=UPI0027DA0C2F|nr:uncharacterized protein LOC131885346 [Tigriopus californicus]